VAPAGEEMDSVRDVEAGFDVQQSSYGPQGARVGLTTSQSEAHLDEQEVREDITETACEAGRRAHETWRAVALRISARHIVVSSWACIC
jgi:hypothetical protein